MQHPLLTAILFGWSCVLFASSSVPTDMTPETQYAATLMEAKQAWQQAIQRKNAWRDTKKLIRSAERSAKTGDYVQAQQLAEQARQQGLNAIRQHDNQVGIGNPGYLY